MPADRKAFLALDGLRGVAATAIVIYHGGTSEQLLPHSYLAVDFFFVLSGFVLGYAYEDRIVAGLSARTFQLMRLVRLYPLYLLGTIGTAAIVLAQALIGHGWHEPFATLFAALPVSLLFLPAPPVLIVQGHSPYPFNFPTWSLFWELAIGVAFWRLAGLRRTALVPLLCGAALLLAATAIMLGSLNVGDRFANFWGGGSRVAWGFLSGFALYRLRRCATAPVRHLPFPAAALILIGLFAVPAGPADALIDTAAALILFPLMVFFAADTPMPAAGRSPAIALGTASYAMYALHAPMILFARWTCNVLHHPYDTLPAAVALGWVALVTPVAMLADRLYDLPLRRLMTRRILHRRHVPGERPA